MQILVLNILAIFALISTPSFAHLIYDQDCDDSPEAALDLTPTPKSDLADESFLNPELNSGTSGIMGRSGETGPRGDELKCYAADPDFQRLRASHPNAPETACLFKSYKAKGKDASTKNYQPGALEKSDAERKREANILLAKGFCQVEFFGVSYCTNWKKKFQLIDSAADSTANGVLPPRTEASPGAPHLKQPEHAAKIDLSKDLPRPSLSKEPAGLLKIP